MSERPFLTSVGVGVPLFGLWGHRYIETRRKHKLRSFQFLGFHVVLASYKRIKEVA